MIFTPHILICFDSFFFAKQIRAFIYIISFVSLGSFVVILSFHRLRYTSTLARCSMPMMRVPLSLTISRTHIGLVAW
jgi:hypothetical protein